MVFMQDPAKVFKGKKMPGMLGNIYITAFGLKVPKLTWKLQKKKNQTVL